MTDLQDVVKATAKKDAAVREWADTVRQAKRDGASWRKLAEAAGFKSTSTNSVKAVIEQAEDSEP